MLQQVIILIIFTGAVAYLGRMLYRNFQSKSDCASGCGKCSAVDLNKIEEKLREKGV